MLHSRPSAMGKTHAAFKKQFNYCNKSVLQVYSVLHETNTLVYKLIGNIHPPKWPPYFMCSLESHVSGLGWTKEDAWGHSYTYKVEVKLKLRCSWSKQRHWLRNTGDGEQENAADTPMSTACYVPWKDLRLGSSVSEGGGKTRAQCWVAGPSFAPGPDPVLQLLYELPHVSSAGFPTVATVFAALIFACKLLWIKKCH